MMRYGTVLQVNDLNLCRCFYRDTLELGEPEIDSTELTVFRLSRDEDIFLVLQRNTLSCLEHASSAVAWFMEVPDAEKIAEKIEKSGQQLKRVTMPDGGFFRICDPEGNAFFITSVK